MILFQRKSPLVLGMIQPEPLPGTYLNSGMTLTQIIDLCVEEVRLLKKYGFDGYIIQNRNDAPVQQQAGAETIAFVSSIAIELKRLFPDMIQGILINWDGVASLAVAAAVGSDFIRVEHTYTSVEIGYAGMMYAQCVDILNLKKRLNSNIPIYADIQEVHYEQLCPKSIVDNAWDTVMNAFANGLFVGGKSTADSLKVIRDVRKRLGDKIPIFLSSGSTGDNIKSILKVYDGVSVGTWIKDGNMRNPINPEKAAYFIRQAKSI